MTSLVAAERAAGHYRITLQAPRANALTPELLTALHAALDGVRPEEPLLLAGGPNFCSGGDVARFAESAARGGARSYAETVVPPLQSLLLRLLRHPAPVAVAARGAVTGGGAGLLFAADIAVLAPGAFVQPYYTEVGSAPDGGWCALLPECIGAGPALSWQLTNRRVTAEEALRLNLCAAIETHPEDSAAKMLLAPVPGAARAAKRLTWDTARLDAVAQRLDAERAAFLDSIAAPEALAAMEGFLGGTQSHA